MRDKGVSRDELLSAKRKEGIAEVEERRGGGA
jgi:hypothetical protein